MRLSRLMPVKETVALSGSFCIYLFKSFFQGLVLFSWSFSLFTSGLTKTCFFKSLALPVWEQNSLRISFSFESMSVLFQIKSNSSHLSILGVTSKTLEGIHTKRLDFTSILHLFCLIFCLSTFPIFLQGQQHSADGPFFLICPDTNPVRKATCPMPPNKLCKTS